MKYAIKNINRVQGDTYPIVIDIQINGTPLNIGTGSITLRYNNNVDPEVIITGSQTVPGTFNFPMTGVNVNRVGASKYSVKVTDADGTITTYGKGDIIFEALV